RYYERDIKYHTQHSLPTRRSSDLDMETGNLIYEFPNEEMYKADGIWIDDDNIFWTIKYYEDFDKVMIKSFDQTGKEVNQAIEPKDRKSTRLNSSHVKHSYAVFCLK